MCELPRLSSFPVHRDANCGLLIPKSDFGLVRCLCLENGLKEKDLISANPYQGQKTNHL